MFNKIYILVLTIIKILINGQEIQIDPFKPEIFDTKFYESENLFNELPYFPNEETSIIEISGINFDVNNKLFHLF